MTYYSHLNFGNKRFVTAAWQHNDPPETEIKTISVAFAFCSPKDSFCKARGRAIAEGRLQKNSHTISIPAKTGVHDSIGNFIRESLEDKYKPHWLANA
jgi:hypothetical protein